MNIYRQLIFAASSLSFFYSGSCAGDAAFERMPKKIAKTYDNGDALAMTCEGAHNEKCLIVAKIGGVKRSFSLDFASRGYVPNMDFVRMIGASYRPWAFGAAISVECDRRDERVLPEDVPSAICYVYLSLNGNGEVSWQELMVVGQLKPEVFEENGGPRSE